MLLLLGQGMLSTETARRLNRLHFEPVVGCPNCWFSDDRRLIQVMTYELQRQLRHTNFLLCEIAGVPGIRM